MTRKVFDQLTFEKMASVMQVMGDANRLRILMLLEGVEMSVGELVQRTGLSQPLVSYHLRLLREAGIVKDREDSTQRYYSLIRSDYIKILRFAERLVHTGESWWRKWRI